MRDAKFTAHDGSVNIVPDMRQSPLPNLTVLSALAGETGAIRK